MLGNKMFIMLLKACLYLADTNRRSPIRKPNAALCKVGQTGKQVQ